MADFQLAKQKAEEVISENFITEPPIKVSELIQNYGYKIVETDLPSEVAGFVDPSENIIYINRTDSPQRKAFTVAHELGHIKLHLNKLKKDPDLGILYRKPLGKKDDDSKEQEANYFAANLLVPEEMLVATRKKYKDLATIENLALLFGVSKDVISYRIDNIFNHES